MRALTTIVDYDVADEWRSTGFGVLKAFLQLITEILIRFGMDTKVGQSKITHIICVNKGSLSTQQSDDDYFTNATFNGLVSFILLCCLGIALLGADCFTKINIFLFIIQFAAILIAMFASFSRGELVLFGYEVECVYVSDEWDTCTHKIIRKMIVILIIVIFNGVFAATTIAIPQGIGSENNNEFDCSALWGQTIHPTALAIDATFKFDGINPKLHEFNDIGCIFDNNDGIVSERDTTPGMFILVFLYRTCTCDIKRFCHSKKRFYSFFFFSFSS